MCSGVGAPEGHDEGAFLRVLRRVAGAMAYFLGQPGAARRAVMWVGIMTAVVAAGLMVEYFFCAFVSAQWPQLGASERLAYSAAAVAACGACAWSLSAAVAACLARDYDHARRCCVAAAWVLWGTEVSTLTVVMGWTSAKLSPDAAAAAAVLSGLLLAAGAVLGVVEGAVYALRNPAAHDADAPPPADDFRGLSNWLTERL